MEIASAQREGLGEARVEMAVAAFGRCTDRAELLKVLFTPKLFSTGDVREIRYRLGLTHVLNVACPESPVAQPAINLRHAFADIASEPEDAEDNILAALSASRSQHERRTSGTNRWAERATAAGFPGLTSRVPTGNPMSQRERRYRTDTTHCPPARRGHCSSRQWGR